MRDVEGQGAESAYPLFSLGAKTETVEFDARAMPILTHKHVRLHRSPEDGERLLVMRYWPRGVRREAVDRWLRDLAPSAGLLREYRERSDPATRSEATGEDRLCVPEYLAEMAAQEPLIGELRASHERGETITLLCACHDPARCHRSVLARLVLGTLDDDA